MSSRARIVEIFIPNSEVSRKTSTVGSTIIADYNNDQGERVIVVKRPQAAPVAKPKRKAAPRKATHTVGAGVTRTVNPAENVESV